MGEKRSIVLFNNDAISIASVVMTASHPSRLAIGGTYLGAGTILSVFFGRAPGTLPENLLHELAPSVLVIVAFLVYYELIDVMDVGMAKADCQELGRKELTFREYSKLVDPEPVYLAQRVLTNQVEQMPVFVFGTIACALFVNGKVAAVLAALWTILRIRYAALYKGSVGRPYQETMEAIARYTIPAYMAVMSMVMATGVQAVRMLLLNE